MDELLHSPLRFDATAVSGSFPIDSYLQSPFLLLHCCILLAPTATTTTTLTQLTVAAAVVVVDGDVVTSIAAA